MNLSQLLLSDRLYHEENEKIISEMKQEQKLKDSQNKQLQTQLGQMKQA